MCCCILYYFVIIVVVIVVFLVIIRVIFVVSFVVGIGRTVLLPMICFSTIFAGSRWLVFFFVIIGMERMASIIQFHGFRLIIRKRRRRKRRGYSFVCWRFFYTIYDSIKFDSLGDSLLQSSR